MLSRLVNDETWKSMTDDCVMEVELDNLVIPLELKPTHSTDVTLTKVRHFIHFNRRYCTWPPRVIQGSYELGNTICN